MNSRLALVILIGLLNSQFCKGQTPSIVWEYPLSAPSFGSAAAADMDNDGYYEIVFTTYTNDGFAHCLNAEDGSLNWKYDIGGCGDVAPIIYDVDLDDTLDVIINGSCNPTVFCINGTTGKLKWSKPSGGGDSPLTIGDIDQDSLPEILFGNFNGEVRILNGEDGSTAKIIQVDPNFNPIQTAPTLVDVNRDNRLDFIVANHIIVDGTYIWAYDFASGDTLWTNFVNDTSATFHTYHGGVVGDIENDGKDEYVIGSGTGTVRAINVEDGTELWNVSVPESNISALSMANLDADEELEIVFVNNDPVTFDERIRVVSGSSGQLEWSYPVTFNSFRGCAISDINGNGQLDLVSGHFQGVVRAVEPYSGLIWELDLDPWFPNNLPYYEVDHGPLLADFDQNGTMDVFVVAGYGTYQPDAQNIGKAFLIEGGNGYCPEWLMFRHDVQRTGYLSQQEFMEGCDTMTTAISNRSDLQSSIKWYPNPASKTLFFEVSSSFEILKVEIFAITGECVFKQSSPESEVHLPDLPNGIYLLRIITETGNLTEPLLIHH